MFQALKKLFGDTEDKVRRKYRSQVDAINALESEFQQLSDDELRAKTGEFRARLHQGEMLDDLLPEAFAAVREAARRTIELRHYDVQLIGGVVLHEGRIAEMKTGEGKTLVATLPLYLNALEGQGAHLVTVNDYLARRDAGWMGPVYHLLDMSVGFIAHNYSARFDPLYVDPDAPLDDERLVHWRPCSRREAYAADITYGTNNEFGFDYLRDNMVNSLQQMVQRGHHFAIVDEVDNILIDEARTPLIISGPASQSSEQYARFAQLVKPLRAGRVTPDEVKKGAEPDGDVLLDPKTRSVVLTEEGLAKIEAQVEELGQDESIYDPQHSELTHYMENALKARFIFHRDKDYVIHDGEVLIVDEFTGRLMPGRRWSDGLHQAVEAKEGVDVRRETVTYATITFQNYFRKYEKLSGMTGTAATEKEEFAKIYNREVTIIPTNRPVIRDDIGDQIYRSEEAKFRAVASAIRERSASGQPILVGTTSVEKSERLSTLLKREKIQHQVLNAKQNVDEARVVAQAGQPGNVTIATNMAGRGTDILLGGNPEALSARYLEEEGVTQEELVDLAEILFEDPKNQKLSPQQVIERPGSKLSADLVAELHRLHAEYEQALQRIDDPREGILLFLIHHVLASPAGSSNQAIGLAFVDAVLNRRHDEVRQMIQDTPWLHEDHIAEIWRVYRDVMAYKTQRDHGGHAAFLAEKVFSRVYTARGRLVQLTLHGNLEAAHTLVEQEPGLSHTQIEDILRIKHECEEHREQIKQAGGLHIVGTERHEARRIDNQLRGRAGRQGDPGSSAFYLSLEDDLMRRFGRMDTIKRAMERLGVEDDMPIQAGIISRSIESAQTRVEGYNFDIRKHTVEYDDVMNKQREVIYNLRYQVLEEADEHRRIQELLARHLDQEQLLHQVHGAVRISAVGTEQEDEALERLEQLLPDVSFDLVELQAADDEALVTLLEPLITQQQQFAVRRMVEELQEFVELPNDAEAYLNEASHAEAERYVNQLWRDQTSDDLEERIKDLFANEFADLIERYLENYDTWVRDQIQQAVNEATNPATDAVNVRLVQRRLSSILPEMVQLNLAELEDLSDDQLQRRLETLIAPSRERGHHFDLLVRELVALVPGLLLSYPPQEIMMLNIPAPIRDQLREQFLQRYELALENITAELPDESAREQLRHGTLEAMRQQLRPLAHLSVQPSQSERQDFFNRLALHNHTAVREVLRQTPIDAIEDMLIAQVDRALDEWRELIGVQDLNRYQQSLMLQTIDMEWQQYLTAMEDLRQGIGLQAVGQRDPLVQYQTAGYRMFQELLENIDRTVVRHFFRQLPAYRQQIANYQAEQARRQQATRAGYNISRPDGKTTRERNTRTLRRKLPKVGRNEPCPCGSGLKYKHCCGKSEAENEMTQGGELVGAAVADGKDRQSTPAATEQVTTERAAARGRTVPDVPAQKTPRGRNVPASDTPTTSRRGRKVKK